MDYIPILLLMGVGVAFGTLIMLISSVLGPKVSNPVKESPFECGMLPVGSARRRVSVRFYLVAILFLLFDIEVVFFFPWAIALKDYLSINSFILLEMGVFFAVLVIADIYVIRKGALEWE